MKKLQKQIIHANLMSSYKLRYYKKLNEFISIQEINNLTEDLDSKN